MDLDRKSGGYVVMQREAKSNRQVYQSLLQQEKELRVSATAARTTCTSWIAPRCPARRSRRTGGATG